MTSTPPKSGKKLKEKPATSWRPRALTRSEIDSLRQGAKETSDYAKKAFVHLRPKGD